MIVGLFMLVMVGWVVMSAAIVSMILLAQVVFEKTDELRDLSFESDDTDEWLA